MPWIIKTLCLNYSYWHAWKEFYCTNADIKMYLCGHWHRTVDVYVEAIICSGIFCNHTHKGILCQHSLTWMNDFISQTQGLSHWTRKCEHSIHGARLYKAHPYLWREVGKTATMFLTNLVQLPLFQYHWPSIWCTNNLRRTKSSANRLVLASKWSVYIWEIDRVHWA